MRALHELLHGHFIEAAHCNALLVACAPLLGVWGVRSVARALQGRPTPVTVHPAWLWTFLAVAVVFSVLRNLPAFTWLAP